MQCSHPTSPPMALRRSGRKHAPKRNRSPIVSVRFLDKPSKAAKKPDSYSKKPDSRSNVSDEYDVLVRALCKCQNPSLVLCHYKGYSSKEDDWISMKRLSPATIEAFPDVQCSNVSPLCPHRSKVGKSSSVCVLLGSAAVPAPSPTISRAIKTAWCEAAPQHCW